MADVNFKLPVLSTVSWLSELRDRRNLNSSSLRSSDQSKEIVQGIVDRALGDDRAELRNVLVL